MGDQAAKILELEHNLEGLTELKQKIEELNQTLETCKADKEHLQELLNDNNYKLQVLQEQTESAEEKERDKDDEIISLQKGWSTNDMAQRVISLNSMPTNVTIWIVRRNEAYDTTNRK